MFTVVLYEEEDGYSELNLELIELSSQSVHNKDARIQFNQIVYCIELLKNHGTRLPDKITKHLQDDIWELRPGNNRVLYFYFENNTFVLLHMFKKKTQKTPKEEIKKAQKERDDYKARNGGK